MENKIKFTIVVITYNFEKIILRCLESIEQQTYKNFEVIISDDSSKDNTIEICEQWKKKYMDKFSIKILSSEKNQGVVKNINKGVKIATGEWIKILAGDDLLEVDALKNIFMFIKNNENAEVIFSKVKRFTEENEQYKYLDIIPRDKSIYKKEIKEQLAILLENNFIVAPSAIIKNELLKKMNYFDEKFKMVEDYPFWIKLLKHNKKFYFLDKVTVLYRQSSDSVSGIKKGNKVNSTILDFKKQFYDEIYKKEVSNPLKIWDKYIEIKQQEFILKNNNKSNIFTQLLRFIQIKNLKKYKNRIIIILLIIYILKKLS